MKTIYLTLMMTVLFSCQDDLSPNDPRNRFPNRNYDVGADNGGSGATDDGSGTTTNAPIDGGLSVLLVAGVAYGAKRYRDTKRKSPK